MTNSTSSVLSLADFPGLVGPIDIDLLVKHLLQSPFGGPSNNARWSVEAALATTPNKIARNARHPRRNPSIARPGSIFTQASETLSTLRSIIAGADLFLPTIQTTFSLSGAGSRDRNFIGD